MLVIAVLRIQDTTRREISKALTIAGYVNLLDGSGVENRARPDDGKAGCPQIRDGCPNGRVSRHLDLDVDRALALPSGDVDASGGGQSGQSGSDNRGLHIVNQGNSTMKVKDILSSVVNELLDKDEAENREHEDEDDGGW